MWERHRWFWRFVDIGRKRLLPLHEACTKSAGNLSLYCAKESVQLRERNFGHWSLAEAQELRCLRQTRMICMVSGLVMRLSSKQRGFPIVSARSQDGTIGLPWFISMCMCAECQQFTVLATRSGNLFPSCNFNSRTSTYFPFKKALCGSPVDVLTSIYRAS